MSEQLNDQSYVGQQKVTEFILKEGTDKLVFTLENSRKDEVTLEQYGSMISPEPYSDGDVSIRKWKPCVDKIIDLFMENDLELVDKDFVLSQIESRVVNAANLATAKLWGTDSMHHVSLRRIDEILKQADKSEDSLT